MAALALLLRAASSSQRGAALESAWDLWQCC
jgi:hypothetical protein